MNTHKNELTINIGGLESVASVYMHTSKGLAEFSRRWNAGETPIINWDIRDIHIGKINVAALSFFLAISHRVKHFNSCPQSCMINWNPQIFGFLSDIDFFKIANTYNLIEWPYEIGGYESGKTNPNTKILSCDPLFNAPSPNELQQISNFKKVHREHYRQYIIDRCESLFAKSDNGLFGDNFPLIMSRTCAEIATNSLLWGKLTPFLGLQRSSKFITISVADIGEGFRNSFIAKNQFVELLQKENHDIHAVALGSVVNDLGLGLKRAISTVLKFNGSISITSNTGEIYWNRPMWQKFVDLYEKNGAELALAGLPEQIYRAEYADKQNGYTRIWNNSIRGSRIIFTIPLEKDGINRNG